MVLYKAFASMMVLSLYSFHFHYFLKGELKRKKEKKGT
jgi:hypothetical protein